MLRPRPGAPGPLLVVLAALGVACAPRPPIAPIDAAGRDAATGPDAGAGDGASGSADADPETSDGAGALDAPPSCRFTAAGFRCCAGGEELEPLCVGPGAWACPAGANAHAMAAWERCGRATATAVESGVRCAESTGVTRVCPLGEQCWESIATSCLADEHPTYYRSFWCDGPEDCAGGVCCLAELPVGGSSTATHLRSACEPAACGAGAYTMCSADADCPAGERCCAGPRSDAGTCRAACFE